MDTLETELSYDYTNSSTDDLASLYNVLLSDTLNNIGTLRSCSVLLPFCSILYTRGAQNEGRRLPTIEHPSMKTGITALAAKIISEPTGSGRWEAKKAYYSTSIAKAEENPRALFLTVNKLVQPAKQFPWLTLLNCAVIL